MNKNDESKLLIKSSLENLGIVRQLKNIKNIFLNHKKNVKDDKFNNIVEDAISNINKLNSDIEKLSKEDEENL